MAENDRWEIMFGVGSNWKDKTTDRAMIGKLVTKWNFGGGAREA